MQMCRTECLTCPQDLDLGHQALAPELTEPVDKIGSQVDEAGTEESTKEGGAQQEPHHEGEEQHAAYAQDEERGVARGVAAGLAPFEGRAEIKVSLADPALRAPTSLSATRLEGDVGRRLEGDVGRRSATHVGKHALVDVMIISRKTVVTLLDEELSDRRSSAIALCAV